MNFDNNKLAAAVRLGLALGTFATVGSAQAQNSDNPENKSRSLETIVVTGSNIRRVDLETANPVITIDREQIRNSGKLTIGDLVAELPAVSGMGSNPRVNNGGGLGQTNVELRGLGTQRTLTLIDGRRTAAGGLFGNDLNAIPAHMVERIEVLTDGAGAVYGSDAIAGVINIILRHNYQGAEFSSEYGVSDRDDGARKNFSFTFGQSTDKGNIVAGIEYNKFDQILAGRRDYSRYTYNIVPSTGAVVFSGSASSVPGFIRAPQFANCPAVAAAGNVPGGARDPNAPGDPTAPAGGIPKGFRCFVGGSSAGLGDLYNFAEINLISTPQERTNFSALGNYKLTDSIEAYMLTLHNKTVSAFQIAAIPVNLSQTGLVISSKNPYNPFGVDIGSSGSRNDLLRLTATGPRRQTASTENDQITAGLKGSIADTSWQWDAYLNYGHFALHRRRIGYIDAGKITASGALGPNCTLPGSGALSTATCLNIMDQNDPNTAALLRQFYSLNLDYRSLQISKQGAINFTGDILELPAGVMSAAFGASYRKDYAHTDASSITLADPKNGGRCGSVAETCTTPFAGSYNVKDLYAELLVPIVKDLPFAHSLNLTLGDRYSKYSTVGSTSNWKAALEWRPIEDLMIRGNVSKVFRAPNMTESFQALVSSFDNYVPPPGTTGYGSASGQQVQVLYSGASVAGLTLKPEHGTSFDFGFIYDPQWLEGLSVGADVYRIYLVDQIVRPAGQTIANACVASGGANGGVGGTSPFCKFINFSGGQIVSMSGVGFVNLGRLDTKGADFQASYRFPETSFGNFRAGFKATYIDQYDNDTQTGVPTVHVAGLWNSQYGNLARWRAVGTLTWNKGPLSASWTGRYVGPLKIDALRAKALDPKSRLQRPSYLVQNVLVGYDLEQFNTRIDVGIDNLTDKQPSFFYQSVTNSNVDVNTYDTIGRYYFGRVTVKF